MANDDYVPDRFYSFCDPIEVYNFTLPTGKTDVDCDFMLNKKRLMEASAGSRLAIGFQIYFEVPILFRMIREQADQDFEIKFPDKIEQFQFTERLEENRRRDDEYKSLKKGERKLRPYRPAYVRENRVDWILESIRKKMRYSDRPNLLVYGNFNTSDFKFDELAREVGQLSNLSSLSSVWILITTSMDFSETSIGRLCPDPVGWFSFNCRTMSASD